MADQVSDSLGEDLPGGQESEGSIQERLSEIKKKAAQMAASKKSMKKEEKNTKKNEQKIVHFLIKFIQSKHNSALLVAVSKALADNISANIILNSLLLTNHDLLSEIDISDFEGDELILLRNSISKLKQLDGATSQVNSNISIQTFKDTETIPEHLKLKLVFWGESLKEAAKVYPHKTFEVFQKENSQISFKYLLNVILNQFLEENHVVIMSQKSLEPMIDQIFIKILEEITTIIENTKYLEGEEL